jgi:dihydrofolate synthase/folylpolyglutamate synthase
MSRFSNLTDWLNWQQTLHPKQIDLGLERVTQVADRLALLNPAHGVISVAGTNGKGSSVAMLESMLLAAGYRTGCYSSPHLLNYNERIRLNGENIDDDSLCAAFEAIDQARGGTSLSYFEFGTLAALYLFARASPDICILEVGLGGRLDAVNIIDADAALVTSIDIDHRAWLGDDRETIGREKAGIFRALRPAVCSDTSAPASVRAVARQLDAAWYAPDKGFTWTQTGSHWSWHSRHTTYKNLPMPALPGAHQLQNAAGVLMLLETLASRYPVSRQAIVQGLLEVSLAGRCQVLPGPVETILDVAHNPASAATLVRFLESRDISGRTRVVLGMLSDKDIAAFIDALAGVTDDWYLATLEGERGLSSRTLAGVLDSQGSARNRQQFGCVEAALAQARTDAASRDRIVVCGSFVTVAKALASHV